MQRRSFTFFLPLLVLSLAGLATLAGLLARLGRVPAGFVHFPVQLLAVALGCSLGFALLRRRRLSLLALALATYHASRVVPWYWGKGREPAPGDWVVVTANLLKDNPLDAPILDVVARESADLLVVQEAHLNWPKRLDCGLAGAFSFRWTGHGLGVFSRHPIDHILHSPGWTVSDLRAGPGIGSDHLPLIARLRPAKEP